MENKLITAMRFAAQVLHATELRFNKALHEPPQTQEGKDELATVITDRTALLNRCSANTLYELEDVLTAAITSYASMHRRGKKQFTITLSICEAYENDT
jgi:hypothetical protein